MRADPLRQITTEEIAAFHRDGAVLLKSVLTPEWVDLLREGTFPKEDCLRMGEFRCRWAINELMLGCQRCHQLTGKE